MTRLFTTCAVLALSASLAAPMLAQATSTPNSQDQGMPANGQTSTTPSQTPSTIPSQTQQMGTGQTTAADLTGQTIYSAKGHKIGTVSAMSTDTHGQQAAAVSIEKYLGMGGQTVLIPVSSLQARSTGGYTTTLSAAELKSLAKLGSGSSSPQ